MIVSEYKLPYTGAEVQEKLNAIGEGDVTAGTYGSYTSTSPSPYYYIPKITVNDQGIVTAASQSYLGTASTKSAGIMDSTMYNYVYNNYHLQVNTQVATYKNPSLYANSCSYTSLTIDSATVYFPRIYGIYAYIYINDTTKNWVPVNNYTYASSSTNYVTINNIEIDSKYDQYNDDDSSVTYVVLSERTYAVSGH